ncbi:hypothetical protein HNQ02_003283 [Flavobacterium sp. 7E]|uniref:XAC2610-related protein n=1 Tax=Flavobacterium sp. 7E TaxID=2735898 RepID=UPI00156E0183|nr:hypothetical protein [Flavobacterium sp. 7E]NRS90343.1 hypothetical protein [Flavobacterium sp. 7E]
MAIKYSIIVIVLFVFFSCHNIKIQEANTTSQSKITATKLIIQPLKTDSTIIHKDSVVILGDFYKAIYKSDDFLYVTNSQGDTIVKESYLHPNFEFDDFNNDNLKDIRIHYMGNGAAVQNLLLFDKYKKTFILVKDFSNFPDPLPIKGTKYYYSYHRSGCADMNWGSDLFYIDNYKTICIGNVTGYMCDEKDEKYGIYIYKIIAKKEVFIKKLPISTLGKYKDWKWGFIKEYWNTNFMKFTE